VFSENSNFNVYNLRKLLCKCKCNKDEEYKPVEWKYRPKIEKVVKNDEIIYDNLSPNYDSLNQDNKTDYTVISPSIYSNFPISNEDIALKQSFIENDYVTEKPPIDRTANRSQPKMYTEANMKNRKFESNYDNIL
jgi:hypothetical protein